MFWSTVAGLVWIAIMTWICYRGIEISARLQYVLLSIEVVVLITFATFALVRVYTGAAEPYSIVPTLDWFNPFTLDFGTVIAPAMLIAIFIYRGWDTAVSVNEETAEPAKTPGRAAIISIVLLLITYALVATAAVAFAGVGTKGVGLGNATNAADVFSAMGAALFGNSVIGHILQLLLAASILTSASASTQTTILPTARTALSMAAYKAIPEKFARIHPKFLTPTWSTIGMGIVSAVFYVLFTAASQNLLLALIGSIGLMIAFYYGLTGFACVWFYRKTLASSFRHFIMRGLFPPARRHHAVRVLRIWARAVCKTRQPDGFGQWQEHHHIWHWGCRGGRHWGSPGRSHPDDPLASDAPGFLSGKNAPASLRRPRAVAWSRWHTDVRAS